MFPLAKKKPTSVDDLTSRLVGFDAEPAIILR